MMTPADFLAAARVPRSVKPQVFGPWSIERQTVADDVSRFLVGWPDYTILRRLSDRTVHLESGEIIMEDSAPELRRHLPIWMNARGRVLVTGLGLGCVVRGLLASPAVTSIDVIEIDSLILRVIGPEFAGNERVRLHHGDALTIDLAGSWDYAWHDLWTDGDDHLQHLHARLFVRFCDRAKHQGAWAFPRQIARLLPWRALGAPRRRILRRAA